MDAINRNTGGSSSSSFWISMEDLIFDDGVRPFSGLKTIQSFRGHCRGLPVMMHYLPEPMALSEIGRRAAVRHPNMVKLIGATTDRRYLVTECLTGGNLAAWLRQDCTSSLYRRMRIMYEATLALEWLHAHGGAHGNVRPEMIHFDVFGTPKLDLLNVPSDEGVLPIWRAPEFLYPIAATEEEQRLQGQQPRPAATETSDVYSLGILLWEMGARRIFVAPWLGNASMWNEFVASVVERRERPDLRMIGSVPLRDLLKEMWRAEPAARPLVSSVRSRLELIMIDVAIGDPSARLFWQQSALRGQDSVRWADFIARLGEWRGSPFRSAELGDPSVRCFKALLKADEGNEVVTIEAFGRVMAWFGPFATNWLGRIGVLCREKWFHGIMNADEAKELLLQPTESAYAFVVRLSAEPGQFSISQRLPSLDPDHPADVVKHFRIYHSDDSFSINGRHFESVQDLIHTRVKEVQREDPSIPIASCRRTSPFARFFPAEKEAEQAEQAREPDAYDAIFVGPLKQ